MHKNHAVAKLKRIFVDNYMNKKLKTLRS